MRLGLRRGGASTQKKQTEWAKRLGAVGFLLDGKAMPLRDVAVSVTGDGIWVNAVGLYAGRHHHGWKPLMVRYDGSESLDGLTPGDWAWRLHAAGAMLDRDSREIRHPCLVQIDDEFLITAIVLETVNDVEVWETATWRTGEAAQPA